MSVLHVLAKFFKSKPVAKKCLYKDCFHRAGHIIICINIATYLLASYILCKLLALYVASYLLGSKQACLNAFM